MKRLSLAITFLLFFVPTAAAASPEGDWFILGGNGGCWTSDKDHPAAKKLIERGRKGCPLNCVAFTPNDEWITLVGGNEFYNSDELHISKKLAEWWKNPEAKVYKCVAFTPQGGWVALADENTFYAERIPPDALKKLDELRKDKVEIRAIAFTPTGGWVILEEEYGVWFGGIPEAAAKKLNELLNEKTRILCTAFDYCGNWVILSAGNGVWTNNPDLPVMKQLLGLKARNIILKWVAFTPGDYPGELMIVRQPTDRITAVLNLDVTRTGGKVEEWFVYGPVAPAFQGQSETKTTLSPSGAPIEEFSILKRHLLFSTVKDAPRHLHATLTIEGELFSRKMCPRAAGLSAATDLSPLDFAHYTRASEHVNYEAKSFQSWLDKNKLRRLPNERDVTFARRAYSFIRHNFTYEYPGGEPHATAISERRTSDCGGLSCVMIAILRANGIPARMLLGRWAFSQGSPDRVTGEAYPQWHVKSEFFAKETGWVPLDMAAAVTDRDRGEYAHFGNDPGDFVTMFADQDYEVSNHVGGRYQGFGMQGMVWFWKGEGKEKFTEKEKWTVTRQPAVKP